MGVVSLQQHLAAGKSLAIIHASGGQWQMDERPLYRDEIYGSDHDCTRATHVVRAIDLGAYLVTEADQAAEAAMRAILESERSDDGIIGEEYGTRNEGAGRQWVLDPIDGTTSFIAGRPIFGTLIALMQEGWPVLGVIDQPIARERWVGRIGDGTTFNGAPIRAAACKNLSDARPLWQ